MTKISGIYKITCIAKNIIHALYVGQSGNVNKRWKTHLSALSSQSHHNPKLQTCYNRWGASSFKFTLLERCSLDKLTEREQYWADKFRNDEAYCNYGEFSDSPIRGTKRSSETRKRISASNTGKIFSPVHKDKISKNHRNKNKTHCLRGHPLSGDNLYVTPKGERACKECRRLTKKRHRARKVESKTPHLLSSTCKRGHPLSGDNLYVAPSGKRVCRECRRIRTEKRMK